MVEPSGGTGAPRVWVNPAPQAPQRAPAPLRPAPPMPGGLPPGGPRPPGHRRTRRRRWPRRLLVGANILVILCLVAAGAGYAYVRYRVGQIQKVAVHGTAAPAPPGKPETILMVGSDSRAGFNGSQQSHYGSSSTTPGQRSDVIILVHLVPQTGKAAMLSIPRDTYVHIAGTGTTDRINSAFNNGPSQLIQTITQDYGIAINHYVEVNFTGLTGLVNTVGGVCMHFPYPARDNPNLPNDNGSGLDITTAGNHHLDGTQALALVRSRYYQYYKDGQWVYDGSGDLGRIKRQHEFLRVLASTAFHNGIRNPFTANSLVTQAVHDVRTDSAFTTSDILRLIGEFRSARPGTTPSWTMPASPYTTSAGADVLLPQKSQDQQTIQAWESYGMPSSTPSSASSGGGHATTTTIAKVAPSSVHVEVLNGSGATGQAQQAANDLTTVGFQVVNYGDANSYSFQTSVVTYGPGHLAQAAAVASRVKGGATVNEDPNMSGAVVTLTTGSSFAGMSATPLRSVTASAASSTTTTAAPASSSAQAAGKSPYPSYDPTPCT